MLSCEFVAQANANIRLTIDGGKIYLAMTSSGPYICIEMEYMKAMQRTAASWLAQLPQHDYLMDTIGLVEEFSTDVTLVITSVEEAKLDMSDIEGDPFHDYLRQWKQIKQIVERIIDNFATEPATKKRKQ
jgi:hypothetical protein